MRNIQITPNIAHRDNASVSIYFHEIGKEELISAEEEAALARKIQEGDRAALTRLVQSNLRFVVSVAKKYQHQGLPLSDLISEGNLGLIKAAERFDESRGFKFISFAVWWIRQAISAAILENARMIRLPMNKIHDITRINRAMVEIERETFSEATVTQLADHLQKTTKQICDALQCAPWTSSYDSPVGEDGSTLLTLLSADTDRPDEGLRFDPESQTDRLLSVLPERERKIIEMSYGIKGGYAMTPGDIAGQMAMSGERIRQLRNAAIDKLKKLTRKIDVPGFN